VGDARAQAITKHFGSGNVQDVLNSDDAVRQLSAIDGIGDKRAREIKKAWDANGRESLCGA
jgi:ERCC4-type nuclease